MVSKEDLEKVYSQLSDKSLNFEELHTSYNKMLADDNERIEQLDKQLSAFNIKSAYKHKLHCMIFIILSGIILCTSAVLISVFSKLSNIQNVLIFLPTSIPLFVSLLLDCKITYKYKKYQALQKELVDAVNLFQLHHISDMYIVEKLNCGMYKDVYEQTYNMQEWLRNNDKAGYASFVHACDMTNMDFSKYVEDYVKPNMTDININNYFN